MGGAAATRRGRDERSTHVAHAPHLVRLGAIALASGATLTAGATAAAGAATASGNSGSSAVPTTLDGIKAKAATDITDRVNDLNAAMAKVNAAEGLGASQANLVSYLGTDVAPLQQLNQTIQGDSTLQQAAHDFGTIFSDYRVYVLVLPASRMAAGGDQATATAIPKLTADATKAQSRVTPANQATLQPLIDDLNGQIGTATNATNGLAATVLAFTPAQWNADNALLAASRSSDQAATGALQKGRADVKQILQDLQGLGARRPPPADPERAGDPAGSVTTAASPCWRSTRWPPWSGAPPGTRRTRPAPTGRSPRRSHST